MLTAVNGRSTEDRVQRSTVDGVQRSAEDGVQRSTEDRVQISTVLIRLTALYEMGRWGRPVCVVSHEMLLPLPCQKSTKIESKTAYKLSSLGRCNYRYREKSRLCPTRYRVFLQRKYLNSI
jgi:hypothetical protein